ncbi:MAG: hypothetical protein K1W06_11320 [Lachnospiraceae bacterium]
MNQVMYIGPAVPGLVKKNTVFKDGPPEAVKRRAEADRAFARLFVPVGKIFEAKKQLAAKGSVLAVSYADTEKNIYNAADAERGTYGQQI